MKKVKLFIATSIDGYIAREDGGLDWLENLPNPDKIDHGYADFYNTLDTTLIGRKTYEEVLGFGVPWPYPDCKTFVVSRNSNTPIKTPNTELMDNTVMDQVRAMKRQTGKDIWLIGGGELISSFLSERLIDEMILNVVPVILGDGIPLFPGTPKETSFELVDCQPFETGIVNLIYRRRE